MKPGIRLAITHENMLKPLEGRLADVDVAGEKVKVRIGKVGPSFVSLVVVDPNTKE